VIDVQKQAFGRAKQDGRRELALIERMMNEAPDQDLLREERAEARAMDRLRTTMWEREVRRALDEGRAGDAVRILWEPVKQDEIAGASREHLIEWAGREYSQGYGLKGDALMAVAYERTKDDGRAPRLRHAG
jgi:hypothetical protein